MSTPKLLSTKALQPAQRSRLLAAGFAVQSYSAVKAQSLPFEMPAVPFQAIFTSQNAVQSFLEHQHLSTALPILEGVFCVGERSAQRLRKKGINVIAVADTALALVNRLFSQAIKPKLTHQNLNVAAQASQADTSGSTQTNDGLDLLSSPLYYFCGDQHLPVIPDTFRAANTPLHTLVIYKSQGVSNAFDTAFDVLFFYSPSGVKAFTDKNLIGSAFVVAIGPTTAEAVAAHTANYAVAKKPSFAHMLSTLRAHYKRALLK